MLVLAELGNGGSSCGMYPRPCMLPPRIPREEEETLIPVSEGGSSEGEGGSMYSLPRFVRELRELEL